MAKPHTKMRWEIGGFDLIMLRMGLNDGKSVFPMIWEESNENDGNPPLNAKLIFMCIGYATCGRLE